MRTRLRFAYVCSHVLAVVVACGGSTNSKQPDSSPGTDGGGGGDAGLTADEACTQSAAMRCSKLQTCSNPDLQKRFGDLSTCQSREKLLCIDALAAPGTANNPAAVAGCTAAVAGESCDDFLADKNPPTACQAQMGSAGDGASCQFDAQCGTAFCAQAAHEVCGTCEPQPSVGTSCAVTGCGQDLICVAATQLCQEPVAAGSACSKTAPCDDDLTCVGSGVGSGGTGMCVQDVGTAGGSCDHTHKAAAGCDLDAGLFCDTLTDQCVAQPIVGPGNPCGLINGVQTICLSASTCQPAGSGSGSGSICIASADDGSACDPSVGLDCLTPASCVATGSGSTAGTCVLAGSGTCD